MNRRDALRMLAMTAGAVGAGGMLPASAASPMLTRPVPSTGELLPAIGLGTWQTFDVGASPSERAPLSEVLSAFASLGGKVIDSSPMYGRSEDVAGELAEQLGLRNRLFIATKVWTQGKEAGIRQMQESMQKLRTRTIDLMQVHNLVDVHTHLDTLEEWKRQGRVRYTGITHYHAGGLDEVIRVVSLRKPDFIQINYSAGEREAERRLLPLAQDKGIAVIANRPFAGGNLFRRLRERPLPPWASEIDCTSWAQLLLKFVLSHPALTCAIPATAKVSHLRDNMQAGSGRLPDQKMRARIVAEID